MLRAFFGTVSPCCLFWLCWPPIVEYKNLSTSCSEWQFFCCSVFWLCQGRVRKKMPVKLQRTAIVEKYCRGVSMSGLKGTFPRFLSRKWKRRRADSGLFWIQPRAPPPAGGFLKFISVMDKLILKISYTERLIPTFTTYPLFPRLLGRKWKRRRADSRLF